MLLQHRILVQALLAMILVALLHFLALHFYFYWQLWWFDIVMHFLGGIVVGLGAMWALMGYSRYRGSLFTARQTLVFVLCATFLVAFSWEIYEFQFGLFDPTDYGVDSSLDIVMGLLGAIVARGYALNLSKKAHA